MPYNYVIVCNDNIHTKKTKQIVGGRTIDSAKAMIFTKYKNKDCCYVFNCYSDDWITSTDVWQHDLEEAVTKFDLENQILGKNIF